MGLIFIANECVESLNFKMIAEKQGKSIYKPWWYRALIVSLEYIGS
jgi:hypothetical protein